MANALAQERSLYLRQHADNPVDWLPWGERAFAAARERDLPLLVSIGYSACHWCHVMERESFSDPEVAQLMNSHFVCVKVDREERPDVDDLYMEALQALRGGGGWPLNVFCTPAGEPFFAGTYYPPEPRGRIPSWRQVLLALAAAWRDQRDQLEQVAGKLTEALGAPIALPPRDGPRAQLLDEAETAIASIFDADQGGFGNAAKFPQVPLLDLLEQRAAEGSARAASIVDRTLTAMALGGICDHVGGGFHRYAVDPGWRVPHFEKMLYDNALLVRAYARAHARTANPLFAERAAATIDFLARELAGPDGLFYASLDADSDGEEGAYYLWRAAELEELLGDLYPAAATWLGVREQGNCDPALGIPPGLNVLYVAGPQPAQAAQIKAALLAARSRRPQPQRDEKEVVSWNGLAVAALAEAAVALGQERYLQAARRAALALLGAPRAQGELLPRLRSAGSWGGIGFLEDHSHLLEGLVALYEAACEPRFLEEAVALADRLLASFWDPDRRGFYTTATSHRPLVRRLSLEDSALPSGAASAALSLARLSELTGERRFGEAADAYLQATCALAARYPPAFACTLLALARSLGEPKPLACPLAPNRR